MSLDSKSAGFLSIDVAFGIVIMSFSFIILLSVQNDISNELQNNDIQSLSIANKNLLHNIRTNAAHKQTLTTNSGKKYNVEFFNSDMPNVENKIKLHFYKIID